MFLEQESCALGKSKGRWLLPVTDMPWDSSEECVCSHGVQNLLTDECRKDGSQGLSFSFWVFWGVLDILQDGNK